MGTNTTNKNNKSSTDVIGVISALAGLATAATPLVANAINNAKSKSSDKAEEKIKIPELYHKGFPIDLEQAVRILEDCGLKSPCLFLCLHLVLFCARKIHRLL